MGCGIYGKDSGLSQRQRQVSRTSLALVKEGMFQERIYFLAANVEVTRGLV
jgi:hypothetical protein